MTISLLCLPLSRGIAALAPLADDLNPGASSNVLALAVHSDGKILVAGTFTNLGGQSRRYIGRLNSDGTVDGSFNPGADNTVHSLAVQGDGKVLVGGFFSALGGQSRNFLGRLNSDGSVDDGFNPGAGGGVRCFETQADGRIVVGGSFAMFGGQVRSRLARIHADGSLDNSFNPVANHFVFALAAQADGRILVGGQFTNLNGQARLRIARLESDGTLDASFTAEANGTVRSLILQPDQKILIGGSFTMLNGQPRGNIGRLNADGTLDGGFDPAANGIVYSLGLQMDGRILAGGDFTTGGGQARDRIARFHADGTLDESFNPGASRAVTALAVESDGGILVGGSFAVLGGQPRRHIGRLNNTEPPTQSLTKDGSTVIWMRGGTAPEISRTMFDYTTDGVAWSDLGAGERIAGGWRVTGVSIPWPVTIRGRGVASGDGAGSRWFVEGFGGNVVLRDQPFSRTNDAGTTAILSVHAIGEEPLSYQWLKDGSPIENTVDVAGATGSTLTLGDLREAAQAGYSVIVSNSFGAVTSQVATLTVADPTIISEPVGLVRNFGLGVTFNVVATGTTLAYQWLKDGTSLSDDGKIVGTTTPTLAISATLESDEGGYSVVVMNSFSSVTSRVAVLTILDPGLTHQPVSQAGRAGEFAIFTVGVVGSGLSYQWLKNGAVLLDGGKVTGAATSTLTLNNLLKADQGGYSVVVTNLSGSATSQVATLTVIDPFIVSSTTNQTRVAGESVTFDAVVAGTAPLHYRWRKDGVTVMEGPASALVLTNVQDAAAGNYSVVVSNAHGVATGAVARLLVNRVALDPGFNPVIPYGTNLTVAAMVVQRDGKIVVGGSGSVGGYVRRFNSDGTADGTFVSPQVVGAVQVLTAQADGKILVGGRFSQLGGVSRPYLGRIHANGTLDQSFNPPALDNVSSLVVQPDGKIVVGIAPVVGFARGVPISRLHTDGTLDSGFIRETLMPGTYIYVTSMAMQQDGKILVAGTFRSIHGQARTNLARLNPDGTLDDGFILPPIRNVSVYPWGTDSSPGYPYSVLVQPDGKILLGGYFSTLDGIQQPGIARLNADGTFDAGFNTPFLRAQIFSMALQVDGRIVVGGGLIWTNGVSGGLQRLNADGTFDPGFNIQGGSTVSTVVVQPDGQILAGGQFVTLGGVGRNALGRVLVLDSATQSLGHNGSVVTWLRSGGSPEVSHTTFDYSLDGTNWINVGAGTRVPGGWQVQGVPLPTSAMLRARGQVVGSSQWVTETVEGNAYTGAPIFTAQPASRTNLAGSIATFSVSTLGTRPFGYQWWKDGAPLADGGRVAGATASILSLNGVLKADEGGYSVVVSNTDGSVTSLVASLTVLDPAISSHPVSQQRNAGQSVTLTVQAAGTAMTYLWLKDGSALSDDGRVIGAATTSLTVLDLLKPDEGGYSVVVTGTHGSVTSGVAMLTVIDPVITSHPASETLNQGESATLSVTAMGTEPLIYQWWKDGVALPQAVDSTLTLPSLQLADSGNYSVVVGNSYGSVTSQVASLTLIQLAITRQPSSQRHNVGQNATFSVEARGLNLTYQWYKGDAALLGGGNVSGVNTPALTVGSLLKADEGEYRVVVSTSVGSVTSSVAALTVVDPLIARHPEHQGCGPGDTVTFSVEAAGTQPFSYQWWKDGAMLPQATEPTLSVTNVQQANLGDYSVVVANPHGSVTSGVARLELSFSSLETAFEPGAPVAISSAAVQADGKILIGGQFTIPGVSGGPPRYNLARFHASGSLDGSFRMDNTNAVSSLAVQPDGKILVGGQSIRLNTDGTRDTNFNAAWPFSTAMALEPDGNIVTLIVIQQQLTYPRVAVVRLNLDGSMGSTLIGGVASDFWLYVKSIVMLPGGGMYIAGGDYINGPQPDYFIGPATVGAAVDTMIARPDGTAYLYGALGRVNGTVAGNFVRLRGGATVDSGFNPPGSASPKVVQADGKLIVSTGFNWPDGQRRLYSRLNTNGTLDESLDLGSNIVHSLLPDGRILAGHWATNAEGLGHYRLARLANTGPATESLTHAGSFITWLRGGTSPETWHASFEHSVNGRDWLHLGYGQLIPGGWRLTNAPAGVPGTIRARGLVAMGALRSHWVVEAFTAGSPIGFVTHPVSLGLNAGGTATFNVFAAGEAPLSYRWRKDGVPLVDGGNVVGVATSALSVGNVLKGDEGGYSVVISNMVGVVTSRVARLTVNEPLINRQPSSQTANHGQSVTFNVVVSGTPPLSYQWRFNGGPVVAADGSGPTLAIGSVQETDAGDYSVVISNMFGSVTSTVAQLAVNLAELDSEFETLRSPSDSFYTEPRALAIQPDGKILVSGSYSDRGPQGPQSSTRLQRLNADGTRDPLFFPHTTNYGHHTLALLTDGKIVTAQSLTWNTTSVVRLHADGTFDDELKVTVTGFIATLAVQADSRILAGGSFATLDGQIRTNLIRINPDGTVDEAFNPMVNGSVSGVAVQTDGRVLVVGDFGMVGGQARTKIARINTDGTLDQTFTNYSSMRDARVGAIVVQSDGKILVGGNYLSSSPPGSPWPPGSGLVRLLPHGALDVGFAPEVNWHVTTLALQVDGRVLVGGNFSAMGGRQRHYLGRLNPDGTSDTTFSPVVSGFVRALGIQADGKVLAGGMAKWLIGRSGQPARLINNTPAAQTLSHDGSTITWLRGGSSPEVWNTTFEYSTDRLNWTNLGAGARIPGGWALTSAAVPPGAHLRARGHVTGGYGNASSWFVEAYSGYPPTLLLQPASRTNVARSSVTFGASAGWTDPLSYQWMRDGVPLADMGDFAGSATARLTVTNLLKLHEGGYSVVVSNAQGSVTSQVAWLTVIDPAITNHPTNQHRNVGESVTFDVAASGTPPLTYQWRKQGVAESLGDTATLSLSQLQLGDAGYYFVVVGNGYGSVTSAVAQLTMNRVTLDAGFAPGSNAFVETMAIQLDRRIAAAGSLRPPIGQVIRRLGRLNADGTLDGAFNPDANSQTMALAVQADGKLLAGGSFSSLGGQPRSRIGRLNADGTLDEGFAASANSTVRSLIIQDDGKILIGGDFSTVLGTSRPGLARLNADGTIDPGFAAELSGNVSTMAILTDGRILVGGYNFRTPGGQSRPGLARLHPDGTLDDSFNVAAIASASALAVQADGKILMSGWLPLPGTQSFTYFGRLNPDGTADAGFNVALNNSVYSIALQADGKIVIGGAFTTLNGQPCSRIARLHADGSLGSEFNPGADDTVFSLASQEDGKILVGGYFYNIARQPQRYVARLNNLEPATQSLSYSGSTITWLRGGSSPEVWGTTFEHSTDGVAWTSLGAGTRIPGGWQLSGGAVPPGASIRARGHVTGGWGNGSSWFVETRLQSIAPMLLAGDGNFGVLSNRFEFMVLGLPGQTVFVDASTNLLHWTPLQTNIIGTGPIFFTDPEWPLYPQRFYRARGE